MRFLRTLATFLSIIAIVAALKAQLPAGSINGIGKDSSGRTIEGLHVLATEESQGSVRESKSNADGSFTFSNLPPGSYTVEVSARGFADVRYSNVQVEPGRATTLDMALQVATAQSTVSVSAETGQGRRLDPVSAPGTDHVCDHRKHPS